MHLLKSLSNQDLDSNEEEQLKKDIINSTEWTKPHNLDQKEWKEINESLARNMLRKYFEKSEKEQFNEYMKFTEIINKKCKDIWENSLIDVYKEKNEHKKLQSDLETWNKENKKSTLSQTLINGIIWSINKEIRLEKMPSERRILKRKEKHKYLGNLNDKKDERLAEDIQIILDLIEFGIGLIKRDLEVSTNMKFLIQANRDIGLPSEILNSIDSRRRSKAFLDSIIYINDKYTSENIFEAITTLERIDTFEMTTDFEHKRESLVQFLIRMNLKNIV